MIRSNAFETEVAAYLAEWSFICNAKYPAPTLKLFQPSGSPIILVFSTPCADTKFQGEFQHGVEKIGDFRMKSPFISDTVYVTLIVSHR